MKLGVVGRNKTYHILKNNISSSDKTIWFHCASLGEYEQGLPVFEEIKKEKPDHKIILSFFSPSGYQIRKNAPIADVVVYLPLDTKSNAETFIKLAHPKLVVFVKYEVWPNYMSILKKRQVNTILISALFRKDQIYFKSYGKVMRKALRGFDHIFVQDKASKLLLEDINYKDITISGDTRFDRVSKQLQIDNHLSEIETFVHHNVCVVCGSTWPEDEALLTEHINNDKTSTKYIIAPHNIKEKQITQLQNQFKVASILHSNHDDESKNYKVLIIDCIGLLSKIYRYANIAYVGGAMGNTGLHNILEPAVFGIPIIIGKNFKKFPEAQHMLKKGGLFSVKNYTELHSTLKKLIDNKGFTSKKGLINKTYIKENQGAVIQIMDYIRTYP